MATILGSDGDIFSIRLDGSGKAYLTQDKDGSSNSTAAWSYDGSGVVYTHIVAGAPHLAFFDVGYIWTMRADGSDKHQLTSGPLFGSLATFSPDGRTILFTGIATGSPELWVMNADGTNPHPITNTTGSQVKANGDVIRWSTNASYSPDGTKIAYASTQSGRSEIWLMNADGSDPTQLTFADDSQSPDANAPMWSPDGSRIAFWSGIVRDNGNIFTIRPDGSDRRQITFDSASVNNDNPMWVPNGSAIVFNSNRDGATSATVDTWIVNADGNGERPLFGYAVGAESRLPITAGDGNALCVGAFPAAPDPVPSNTSMSPPGLFLATSAADGSAGAMATMPDGMMMPPSPIDDPGNITLPG